MGPPSVKAKATGPLALVTILGFTLSLILFTSSILFGDGMSFIATSLLSFLSTLIGAANKWTLKLAKRTGLPPTPGDTVIRYPNGGFLIVKCEEDVARELYFAPEEIEYSIATPAIYRMISLVGTIMLMLGVVAAAVPPKLHWDLSCYEVKEQSIEGGWKNETFTEVLWKAILATKSTRWTKAGKAAPQTELWDQWLIEAEAIAKTAPTHIGEPLYDLAWPRKDSKKGVIYEAPKDWSPKAAWDAIDRSLKDEQGTPQTQTA